MRRVRANPPLPGGAGGKSGTTSPIVSDEASLVGRAEPFIAVVDGDGLATYKRKADGTYTKVSSEGGEHTKVELVPITPADLDEAWTN